MTPSSSRARLSQERRPHPAQDRGAGFSERSRRYNHKLPVFPLLPPASPHPCPAAEGRPLCPGRQRLAEGPTPSPGAGAQAGSEHAGVPPLAGSQSPVNLPPRTWGELRGQQARLVSRGRSPTLLPRRALQRDSGLKQLSEVPGVGPDLSLTTNAHSCPRQSSAARLALSAFLS